MTDLSSIIGKVEFTESLKIKKITPFKDINDFIQSKPHNFSEADRRKMVLELSEKKFHKYFLENNLILTKLKIKASVSEDNLISQAINSISDNSKILNTAVKRLREWYSLSNPENEKLNTNNKKIVYQILKKNVFSSTMGANLKPENIQAIKSLARIADTLYIYQEDTTKYLENLMKSYCPNLHILAGTTIGARLIEHAGSLRKLSFMAASKIQILGAEKAIFRHLKTGAKPPKYGLLHDHQFIVQAKRGDSGKRARALADKISMAVKVDYFKGKLIAPKLKKELDSKFGKQK